MEPVRITGLANGSELVMNSSQACSDKLIWEGLGSSGAALLLDVTAAATCRRAPALLPNPNGLHLLAPNDVCVGRDHSNVIDDS